MTNQGYYLLKLIDSVPELEGRKRLQKLMYLMKYAGFPIEVRYSWHYYGPYSADLALQIDSLVDSGLLKEEDMVLGYRYKTSEAGKTALAQVEGYRGNRKIRQFVSAWLDDFKSFSTYKVSDLEKASSVLYWKEWGKREDDAIRTTESLKGKLTACVLKITKDVSRLKASSPPR
jgi:uncharacterized protein YwgA